MKITSKESSDIRLARLFQRILSLLLLVVFIGIFIHFAIEFLAVIGTLNQKKVGVNFQRTVNEVHGAWLKQKQPRITLSKLNENMEKLGSIVFTVNEFGWPVAVENSDMPRCRALFTFLQGEPWQTDMSSHIKGSESNQSGCAYTIKGTPWFVYSFADGSVISVEDAN